MAKLSIKVVVAGRTYPLSVNESEQEKVMRAAEDINNSIKFLQKTYAVRDMQDLLAMTALQLASKAEKASNSEGHEQIDLSSIEKSLTDLLEELKD